MEILFLLLAEFFFEIIDGFNLIVIICMLALTVVFVLFAGFEIGLSGFALMVILYFFFFIHEPSKENPPSIIKDSTIYPTETQRGEPVITDMEIPAIPKIHNIPHIEDEISSDPTVKNLNQLLKNPENLTPGDKQKLEQMREKRIKHLMDEKGKAIIDDYNRNNPEPIISNNQNEKQEALPNTNIEVINQEKKQAKPNDKFISVIK